MKVKISSTVLSISPYISTPWKNISSLQIGENGVLIVQVYDGGHVEIPNLEQTSIDAIFEAHARYTDAQTPAAPSRNPLESPYTFSLPINADGGGMLPAMAHNPEQSHLDPLPPEVLQKIGMVARALGLDETSQVPQGEPHCNCLFCQVVRSIHGEKQPEEIIVAEEDLKFRDWEVKQKGDKLYDVTNPLDTNEQYHVFLGDPLGCTCGNKNCEHIRAVLNT